MQNSCEISGTWEWMWLDAAVKAPLVVMQTSEASASATGVYKHGQKPGGDPEVPTIGAINTFKQQYATHSFQFQWCMMPDIVLFSQGLLGLIRIEVYCNYSSSGLLPCLPLGNHVNQVLTTCSPPTPRADVDVLSNCRCVRKMLPRWGSFPGWEVVVCTVQR